MKKEMFINAQRDECRIAVTVDGSIGELYVERASHIASVGSIYKGKVTNVEPSIQAAFVDFGKAKNGFLHISDVHPQFFPGSAKQVEAVGKKRSRRDRPPIQACLRRGQEVIVQVTKEGIGTKGATLTTYISIPGRYLVLMPGMHRLGVSRKIEDETDRSRMREILEELKPPPDVGFIVRTAGLDRPKRELQRDLGYLVRLWQSVVAKSKQSKAPAELYQESDLVIRTIRDVYNSDIHRIVCDNEAVAVKIKEFLKLTQPRSTNRVELYEGGVGLFHTFGLEKELENISTARVQLDNGGYLVIDQTEALVAIDVNSGRFREADSAEQTALRMNLEAAVEAARQLRLRDMGGVIIIDFIDMVEEKHRRQVENALRDELKKDRARTKVLKISRFGIVEMTRQRVRPSLQSSIFQLCPACGGAGKIKSQESSSLGAMRMLSLAADEENLAAIELIVRPAVAEYILNARRDELVDLERSSGKRITIRGQADIGPIDYHIVCKDAQGADAHWDPTVAAMKPAKQVPTREITLEDLAHYRALHEQEPLTAEEMALEASPDVLAQQAIEADVEEAAQVRMDEEEDLWEGDEEEGIGAERDSMYASAEGGWESDRQEAPRKPIAPPPPPRQQQPSRPPSAQQPTQPRQPSGHRQPAGPRPGGQGQAQPPRGQAAQGQGGQPVQAGQAGQGGQGPAGEGQDQPRRRRRRRGGRRHRRHKAGLAGQGVGMDQGVPQGNGQPATTPQAALPQRPTQAGGQGGQGQRQAPSGQHRPPQQPQGQQAQGGQGGRGQGGQGQRQAPSGQPRQPQQPSPGGQPAREAPQATGPSEPVTSPAAPAAQPPATGKPLTVGQQGRSRRGRGRGRGKPESEGELRPVAIASPRPTAHHAPLPPEHPGPAAAAAAAQQRPVAQAPIEQPAAVKPAVEPQAPAAPAEQPPAEAKKTAKPRRRRPSVRKKKTTKEGEATDKAEPASE